MLLVLPWLMWPGIVNRSWLVQLTFQPALDPIAPPVPCGIANPVRFKNEPACVLIPWPGKILLYKNRIDETSGLSFMQAAMVCPLIDY